MTTGDPKQGVYAEGRVLATDAETVTADDLGIGGNDFVATGDVLPISSFNAVSANSSGTTSTSYSTENGLGQFKFQWDFPADTTTVVAISGGPGPGTDETYDFRWYNNTDSEEMVSVTGITSGGTVWSGWTEYTPTTTADPITTLFQHRTNPGNNSSSMFYPTYWIGVQL